MAAAGWASGPTRAAPGIITLLCGGRQFTIVAVSDVKW